MKVNYWLVVLCVVQFSACGDKNTVKERSENTLTNTDRDLIRYTAQDHLIDMITLIKINGADNKDFKFLIKAADKSTGKNKHYWGRIFKMQNDSFKCVVTSVSEANSKIKIGDTLLLSQSQTEDWIINDKARGNNFGNFAHTYIKEHAK